MDGNQNQNQEATESPETVETVETVETPIAVIEPKPLSLLEMLEITIADKDDIKAKIEAIENHNLQFELEWDARVTDLELLLKGGE